SARSSSWRGGLGKLQNRMVGLFALAGVASGRGRRHTSGIPRPERTAMPEATPEAKILAAIRAIPRGQVAGYGEVARRAGLPGRARLVARILSHNDDARLPWHRVLRSDGRIAFPEGSRAYREQSQRLR